MCYFFNKRKKYKRYVRRMETSITDTLKLSGCALSHDELIHRTGIPAHIFPEIIKKMIKKKKVFREYRRDSQTGKFIGIRYCEFIK